MKAQVRVSLVISSQFASTSNEMEIHHSSTLRAVLYQMSLAINPRGKPGVLITRLHNRADAQSGQEVVDVATIYLPCARDIVPNHGLVL